MECKLLNGDNIKKDAKSIVEMMEKDDNTVFVYTGLKKPLYAYIEQLDEKGKLPDENQFKLKICYEKTGMDLNYKSKGSSGHRTVKVTSMHQLIGLLDKDGCYIIVNNDDRSVLAEIIQQFIYIGYPLTKAEVMLKKDEKDRERAGRFMKQVDELDQKLKEAVKKLDGVTFDENRVDIQDTLKSVKESCKEIQQQMDKARNRQLKIAVAASKKTGKSVIVNGMIGKELAPTSLELATPNSCIYKKSDDGEYYLDYKGKRKHFISPKELREEIGDEFKKAQEKVSDKFTLPDMEIGYVSEKNNFEAYTIYDTPGPDAAGTGHGEKAREAMEQCDVAIFAIDYTKYLTTTEEEYLSQIKEQFNTKQKFNSLIFTINKVDERYNDASGSKSVTKSVDFIRNRLIKIDERYRDCAIFATSALQYFYTLEAEEECGDDLKNAKDLYAELRTLIPKYKNVKGQLNFLDGCVGDMVSYSGLSNITLENLRQYSGMPDLLEYTSYIARTKARDELVNSVAYVIDLQQGIIRAVVNRIENIRRLVDESNERIQEITEIFKEFEEEAKEILEKGVTEEDIAEIEKQDENCALRMYWDIIKDTGGEDFTFEKIKEKEQNLIQKFFADYFDADTKNNLPALFMGQMRHECWQYFKNIQKNKTIVYDINAWLTEDTVTEVAKKMRNGILKRLLGRQGADTLDHLNKDCEKVLQYRKDELKNCIDDCERRLTKIDFEYSMPTVPEFSCAVAKSSVEDVDFGKLNDSESMRNIENALKELYKKPNLFKRLKENIKNNSWGEVKYQANSMSKREFDKIFNLVEDDITSIYKETKLRKILENDRDLITDNIGQHVDEISGYFNNIMSMFKKNIEIFTSSIDDREIYQSNIEKLEEEECVINQIKASTSDFMALWEKICNDETDLSKETA